MRTVRSSSHVYPSMHWALCIPACTGQGGVSEHALGGGRVYAKGVSAQGGCLPGEGGCILACTEADTPPTVDRMTDRCKNITFANYVCGR